MSTKQSSNVTKGIVATVIGLFIALLMVEGSLQLLKAAGVAPGFFAQLGQAKPPLDRKDGPGMYYVHPYSAYAMKPDYESGDRERINNLGFRGEDISPEKPDGVYRIVAIGGSTTFAVYLPWRKSYPYYLQEILRERLGTDKIEVINAGMTGSTSGESLSRLYHQLLPIDPDMVIVYHGYNDLFPRVFNDWSDDYFHFRKSNTHNPPGMTSFISWRLMLKVLNPVAFHENYNLTKVVWKVENLPDSDTERMRNFYNSDASAFERNMEYIVKAVADHGAVPVLATFGISPDIVHWNDYIPAFAWEEGIRQNNRAIRAVADRNDVPLVPFAEAVLDKPAKNLWREGQDTDTCCWNDSIHMTGSGNVLKAEIFADTIEPIIREEMGL